MRNGDRSGWRPRLRYRFDRVLAHGTWATLLWLGVVTLAVVAFAAVVLAGFDVTFTSNEDVPFFEDFWQALLRVLDPGTMAGDVGWGRRFLALGITLFGLLVAGTLIGIIAAGVEDRIERMRRGRSVVFESGHIVVLGESDRLPTLVRQLVLDRAQRGGGVIVVMAGRDAADMQEDVQRVVSDRRGIRLVFRSGDPTQPDDLQMVRVSEAEMVIVLSSPATGDSDAIRTVIAVESMLGGRDLPVVVELSEVASAERLVGAYPTYVHPIVLRQAMARIAAVALRQPGLGQVVEALLDDRGSDVHIVPAPALGQQSFAEVFEAYTDAIPIGYLRNDGSVWLNPPPDERFTPDDRLVLVSESAEPLPTLDSTAGALDRDSGLDFEENTEQHLLILEWSELGASLIADWVATTSDNSTAEIFLDPGEFEEDQIALRMTGETKVTIAAAKGFDAVVSRFQTDPQIDTVVLLTRDGEGSNDEADTKTLLTHTALRRALSTIGIPTPRVLVEILDVDNVALVDLARDDDFIVSDAIGSQLISQLAQSPESRSVFLELYDTRGGPSLRLIPASAFGLNGSVTTGDILRGAFRHGVLAIGYWTPTDGLVINPPRPRMVMLGDADPLVIIG